MADGRLGTVLVASDFSRTAESACRWAARIARPHEARVVLFHAIAMPLPIPSVAGGMPPAYPPPSGEQATAHHEIGCRARRLREAGCHVEVDIGIGPAPEGILEAAARWHADLILVGTHGRTGVGRLLLGSVAGHVVRRATIPTLTVHPRDTTEEHPLRRVLVPTDFSDDAGAALGAATRLLGPAGADASIVLLHAVPRVRSHLGGYDTPESARARLDALAADVARLGHPARVAVHTGNAAEAIAAEAASSGADLVAMGTRGHEGVGRLLLGSTAEHVLPHAPCPVLTVRRPPGAPPAAVGPGTTRGLMR